jgi:hypothetical protein
MTQQVFDAIRFAGLEYTVVGANGSGLFRVADHGFAPQSVCSACWRGAWLQYRVVDEHLQLRRVSTFDDSSAPAFLGRAPIPRSWGVSYDRLAVPVAFTGGLLAARRMVQGRRRGPRPTYSWDYEQVLELSFAAGRLELVLDHSDALRGFRARGLSGTENEAVTPNVYRRSYAEMPDGPWMW